LATPSAAINAAAVSPRVMGRVMAECRVIGGGG
jgi:hypothetical protein